MKYRYSRINSPVGVLHLLSNSKKLVALIFNSGWKEFRQKNTFDLIEMKDSVIKVTEKQLKEYFAGGRTEFDIPIEFQGTEFQTEVWKSLLSIPYGKTVSYTDQAKAIKNPKAVRAVGGANGKNKICIIVPCHRVVGQNGSLTGFAGGIRIKEQLLSLEKAIL